MLKTICGAVVAIALGTLLIVPALRAQGPQVDRQERWRFYSPTTPVSDDPRRVPIPPGPQGPSGTLVLRGGRIFDGTGVPAREGTLVITGNKIMKVLAPGANDWPPDAQVIDVHGETVIPGLIDLHTHLSYSNPGESPEVTASMPDAILRGTERLRYYIESGITSVRDVASNGEVPFRLQAWVNQNRIAGPRIFAAGQFITGIGGH
jgi:imidazolonepropionase-like amidohydrolase